MSCTNDREESTEPVDTGQNRSLLKLTWFFGSRWHWSTAVQCQDEAGSLVDVDGLRSPPAVVVTEGCGRWEEMALRRLDKWWHWLDKTKGLEVFSRDRASVSIRGILLVVFHHTQRPVAPAGSR